MDVNWSSAVKKFVSGLPDCIRCRKKCASYHARPGGGLTLWVFVVEIECTKPRPCKKATKAHGPANGGLVLYGGFYGRVWMGDVDGGLGVTRRWGTVREMPLTELRSQCFYYNCRGVDFGQTYVKIVEFTGHLCNRRGTGAAE